MGKKKRKKALKTSNPPQPSRQESSGARIRAEAPASEEAHGGRDFRDYISFVWGSERRLVIAFSILYGLAMLGVYYCYPHPFVMEDSLDFLFMAEQNRNMGIRPIGYAVFLDALHLISRSYHIVTGAQFAMGFIALLFFLTTVTYFFRPKYRWVSVALYGAAAFAPSVLYINVWLTSDAFFTALAITWLTLSLWMIRVSKKRLTAAYLLILLFLGNTRYIGVALSAVPSVLFALRRSRHWLVVAVLSLLIGAGTYFGTKQVILANHGVSTISGISGKARMNGVGLMYPHLGEAFHQRVFFSKGQRTIHHLMAAFYKHRPVCFDESSFFKSETPLGAGPLFMWNRKCPLSAFQRAVKRQEKLKNPQATLKTSLELERYADTVIKAFPLAYLRYYIYPNFQRLFFPEFLLEGFAYKNWKVRQKVRSWFDVTVERFEARWDVYFTHLRPPATPVNGLLWVLTFLALPALFVFRKRIDLDPEHYLMAYAIAIYMAVYIAFSLVGHPILFRYLIPLHAAQMGFLYMVVNGLLPAKTASRVVAESTESASQ